MARGVTLVMLLTTLAATGWWLMRPPAIAPDPIAKSAKTSSQPLRSDLLVGSASCGGRSCHGGIEIADKTACGQNEYTLWRRDDPHGRAYQTLLAPVAQTMAERLNLGKAHEAPLCLSCHVSPLAHTEENIPALEGERHVGVGCEACHGSATRWLEPHVAAGWRDRSASEKWTKFGLVPLGDSAVLARKCADCHVGSPNAEVDHDLIAAGHPRLAFELSSYFANLPPHWKARPVREGHLWALGQALNAERALELTKRRAGTPTAPWPDLAEFDCFSCHHDLNEPSWRQEKKPGRPGEMRWGTWYFSQPVLLAQDLTAEVNFEQSVGDLRRLLSRPHATRRQTAAQSDVVLGQVKTLVAKLADWQDTAPFAQARIDFLRRQEPAKRQSWDEVEQMFLALEALNQVAGDVALRQKLLEALPRRALPQGLSSPLSRMGGFRPDEVARLLGAR